MRITKQIRTTTVCSIWARVCCSRWVYKAIVLNTFSFDRQGDTCMWCEITKKMKMKMKALFRLKKTELQDVSKLTFVSLCVCIYAKRHKLYLIIWYSGCHMSHTPLANMAESCTRALEWKALNALRSFRY